MRKVKIRTLSEAIEVRDKQIALAFAKYKGSLRKFAREQDIELTLAWRAVHKWGTWAKIEQEKRAS